MFYVGFYQANRNRKPLFGSESLFPPAGFSPWYIQVIGSMLRLTVDYAILVLCDGSEQHYQLAFGFVM